jgi:hypothetical protein
MITLNGPWTIRENGDANEYTILDKPNHWLITVLQINGELTLQQQRKLMQLLAAAPQLVSLARTLTCAANLPAFQDVQQHARAILAQIDGTTPTTPEPDDNGHEIRHDLHGFYICTTEEAQFEDIGNNSVGFDGRKHYPAIEDALDALAALGDLPDGWRRATVDELVSGFYPYQCDFDGTQSDTFPQDDD